MRDFIYEMFSLKGKVAIITGGNSGIGRGIARGLAGAGANIVMGARNEERTRETVMEIERDFGVLALGLKVDVRSPQDIQDMVGAAADRFGTIDIAVANAGIAYHKPPEELSIEEWNENIEVNLRHTFVLAKAVYPFMRRQGGGKIITIGSMTSLFGIPFLPAYGASKGGILQLTRSLATAWAKDNIQVNCILPGFINTGLSAQGRREVPGMEQAVIARTPAGRWGEPSDLVGTAIFLASRASDFVTGAAIAVDGGYSVQG